MKPSHVLIIGLDGATFDLARPWMAAGHLPNLARLHQQGASGALQSTIHPITGAAWPSFMTGANQGQHSVYDFVRRRPGTYELELMYGSHIAVPTLFELVGQAGLPVISLNVPITYPPRLVNGVMVSGLFAQPSPDIAYPRPVYDELHALEGEYIISPAYNAYARDPRQDYLDQLHRMTRIHLRAMRHLLATRPWQLGMVVFTATDLAQHAFWADMEAGQGAFAEAILNIYRQVDAAVGDLLTDLPPETLVVLMSDHGAGPLDSFVQLNRWLYQQGFLKFRPGRTSWRAKVVRAAWAAWRRVLPPKLIGAIRARVGKRYNQVRDQMESTLFSTRIDWPHTQVFALGACGNLFLNVKGREPEGVVEPGAHYDQVCADVTARLMQLTDPLTGQKLVENVLRGHEVYAGPHAHHAPDLVILWKDYRYWGRGRYDFDDLEVFRRRPKWDFSELPLTCTHRMNGLVFLAGPNIRAGHMLTGARIVDVTPTLLAALGLPIPDYMDGRVLHEAFVVPPQAAISNQAGQAPVADSGYTAEEAAEIEEHLKSLGYL